MFFRLELLVDGIFLQGNADGSIEVTITKPRSTRVRVERGELHGLPTSDGRTVAVATFEIEPNERVLQAFRDLSEGRLPIDTPKGSLENWGRFQAPDGSLRKDTILPVSGLPDGVASFITQIRRDLYGAIKRTCALLRWRHCLGGPHNPFSRRTGGAEWSLDGTDWHLLPGDTGFRISMVPSVYPTKSVRVELQALLDQGDDEPMAHQLFREAVDNLGTNRRSALVIGVAALEVGLKRFLGTIIPAADWLVINLPAPPVKRIIAEYLPTVTTPLTLSGRVLVPATSIGLIDKAILLRNRVAHVTGEDVDYDRLDDMLTAIQDALWLFDYYSGRGWALAHLSDRCRHELGITDDGDHAA